MSVPKNSTCPLCKVPLREYHDYVTCPACQTSYHEKCWRDHGGCPQCSVVEKEPVSAAPLTSVAWYLFHNNRNLGPLSWEELCSHPDIQPDDLVWNREMPDWIRADQLPDLPLVEKSETAEETAEEPGDPAETAPGEAAPALEEPPTAVSAPPGEGAPESDPETGADQAGAETAWASEEEDLFPPEKEQETETGDTDLEAASPVEEEPLPAGTAPDGGGAPEADGQPETDEEAELEAAPTAVDELLPEAGTFPEKLPPEAEMAEESEAGAEELELLAAEPPPAKPADLTRSFDSSRAEQLLEQIYTDQEKEPHSILAARAGEPDGRAEAALIHARQVIAGIMLVLGGAIATATTYFYAVSGTIYYLISAAAVIFGLAGFFRGLSGWLKLRPWHNDDNSTPQQEPRSN